MTENDGRPQEPGRGEAPDLIDDALKLVDGLQRKLVTAGVRRGVGAVTSAPRKGDVWEEAIRLETKPERPAVEELFDIVRTSAPEVAGHLGRAGLALAGALGRTWDVVERSLEQTGSDASRPQADDSGAESAQDRREEAKPQVTSGD
ncbi:hypothetical protein [Nocardiopsis sp. NRRL B-16309]|uniref:hypothetical protein n=1 Tax=Nocardiopsis sp. NRRL B-16309 TaxID=1519494 RepID=UPI0006AEA592|nr:hypothetical protein [Nocardiopsis sp. NRRL B-16309]KOX23404.1 hypothetical protein ADL05_02855 [Nocardiopsis sp. NRRL B-16309]